MAKALKLALVSSHWSRLEHRFLAGALHYAETEPGVLIRVFAPCKEMLSTTAEVERWGANGILGIIGSSDLDNFVPSQSYPIPIVNFGLTNEFQNLTTIAGDFQVFLDKSITHLRHLGLKSFGMFSFEESGTNDEHYTNQFLKETRPADPKSATLILPVPQDIITNPDADVRPVPKALVNWLRDLPKPGGIICTHFRSGNYLARCCTALGVMVPKEIAIIASDDPDFCLACEPTLTSIMPSMEIVGTKAAKLLVGILQGAEKPPRKLLVDIAEMTVRESTGLRRPEICDIGAALAYIQANATRGVNVGQLIRETQRVSAPTFHSRFREATGKSPARAIRDRKLEEVRRLLTTTELPMGMIADLCGFSSSNVMARKFRATEFMSPKSYRKRHQRKTAA